MPMGDVLELTPRTPAEKPPAVVDVTCPSTPAALPVVDAVSPLTAGSAPEVAVCVPRTPTPWSLRPRTPGPSPSLVPRTPVTPTEEMFHALCPQSPAAGSAAEEAAVCPKIPTDEAGSEFATERQFEAPRVQVTVVWARKGLFGCPKPSRWLAPPTEATTSAVNAVPTSSNDSRERRVRMVLLS